MLHKLLNKSNIDIIAIKSINTHQPSWGGNGVIFYVKNGKSLLSVKYGLLENETFATLAYGNTPLIKFHGDGPYFCPTCEKLVAAGYGLNMSDQKVISEMRDVLNKKFISLEESVENLKPLLGLLPTGYYALVDTELYPTNGNGEFFWKLNNKPDYNMASCPIYGGDGIWSESTPNYILPTQPPSTYNPEQAEYYRNKDGYRAIAYHFDGYLCALLDGHHKVVAAALDKKKVKSLVILPVSSVWEANKEHNIKGGISINGVIIQEDELLTPITDIMKSWKMNQLRKAETEEYLAFQNDDFDKNYEWPPEILEAEKTFPDALGVARIEWAGDISDKRLDRVLNKQESLSDEDCLNIAAALYYSANPRLKEVMFSFCKDYSYVRVWYDIYKLLANIEDDDVEEFFIDYLIQDDKEHPDIKKIIDNYFVK